MSENESQSETLAAQRGSGRNAEAAAARAPAIALRVVKLGGSLLELPDVAARLLAWLAAERADHTLLVVGGGALVDAIRDSYKQRTLDDVAAHWLAVRAMTQQAESLRAALPEAPVVASARIWGQTARESSAAARPAILDPWRFLREEDGRDGDAPLPASWDVTSDSIAARAARIAAAEELVLLKSAPAPVGATLAELAAAGYVDRYFPRAAAGIARVRFVDLRGDDTGKRS